MEVYLVTELGYFLQQFSNKYRFTTYIKKNKEISYFHNLLIPISLRLQSQILTPFKKWQNFYYIFEYIFPHPPKMAKYLHNYFLSFFSNFRALVIKDKMMQTDLNFFRILTMLLRKCQSSIRSTPYCTFGLFFNFERKGCVCLNFLLSQPNKCLEFCSL